MEAVKVLAHPQIMSAVAEERVAETAETLKVEVVLVAPLSPEGAVEPRALRDRREELRQESTPDQAGDVFFRDLEVAGLAPEQDLAVAQAAAGVVATCARLCLFVFMAVRVAVAAGARLEVSMVPQPETPLERIVAEQAALRGRWASPVLMTAYQEPPRLAAEAQAGKPLR